MGTCKECKWWSIHYEGECDLPNTIHADKDGMEFNIVATVNDDQGLETQLITGRDFGCNRFEPRHNPHSPVGYIAGSQV